MQHLRLWIKMAIVIGLLVVTALVITIVSIVQLHTLNDRIQGVIDVTVKQQNLAAEIGLDVLQTIRAQKNSIISTTDAESKQFADDARKYVEAVNQSRTELRKSLEQHGSAEEKQAFADFEKSWQEFQAKQ